MSPAVVSRLVLAGVVALSLAAATMALTITPNSHDPDMGGPSRPAVLGGDIQQQSYRQLTTAVGRDLVGTHSYPARGRTWILDYWTMEVHRISR
jgi:hypothetical protein